MVVVDNIGVTDATLGLGQIIEYRIGYAYDLVCGRGGNICLDCPGKKQCNT
jgi:hypothetical protein